MRMSGRRITTSALAPVLSKVGCPRGLAYGEMPAGCWDQARRTWCALMEFAVLEYPRNLLSISPSCSVMSCWLENKGE